MLSAEQVPVSFQNVCFSLYVLVCVHKIMYLIFFEVFKLIVTHFCYQNNVTGNIRSAAVVFSEMFFSVQNSTLTILNF